MELPKPVVWRSQWPELDTWKLTSYFEFKPNEENGRVIDPLFTAEQVAELMDRIEGFWNGGGTVADVVLIEKFRAAYCKG